jgi:hypothetical protein
MIIPKKLKLFIMYKHFTDKKVSNKIKLGRVNSKLTDAQLREIRQSAIDSLYASQGHLKEAVMKSLGAFNIDLHEDGIEGTVQRLAYANSRNYDEMFTFVLNTIRKLEDKIS